MSAIAQHRRERRRMPRPHGLALLCGAVLIALAALPAPAALAQQGAPATPVVIAKVRAVTDAPTAEFTGVIEPATTALLSTDVIGRAEQVLKQLGDPVQTGEVVAVLSNPEVRQNLAVAKAQVRQMEAQMRLAEQQQRRVEELFRKKLTSAQNYEDGQASIAVTAAQLDRARVEAERLQDQLERMVIRSPIDGQVINANLELGQWVTPSEPIYEIYNYDSYELVVGLPGRLLTRVHEGEDVAVTVPEVSLTLEGQIVRVVRHVKSGSGNFDLRLLIQNPRGAPLSGMLAKAKLPLGRTRLRLTVPRDAVVRRGQRTHVVTVDAKQRAQIVPVRVGGNLGEDVIVSGKGLRRGMKVVVRGNERLFPGTPVRVTKS